MKRKVTKVKVTKWRLRQWLQDKLYHPKAEAKIGRASCRERVSPYV